MAKRQREKPCPSEGGTVNETGYVAFLPGDRAITVPMWRVTTNNGVTKRIDYDIAGRPVRETFSRDILNEKLEAGA